MNEQTVTMQVYCRLEVIVTDPAAVSALAVRELRAADIDWSTEEDDLESAVEELRADLASSLAGVVDISGLVDGIPGVEFRGGLCWAEQAPPRDPFGQRDKPAPAAG
ncbi:hypothetical protein ACWD6L_01450 [Micromonospora profundi]|uniref:hypothetical protein n=1 Tax=Micromonospora TaxID=1873 RepID=UPI0006C26F7A|nr:MULTISPECIES: hypothetical protein [Micromonospora]KOX14754.1 hypothetical protein ADK66_01175 [Micromonospora sp. NRRL B-16802]NJC15476.1 hypothetical protein [Micromonospora profundi]